MRDRLERLRGEAAANEREKEERRKAREAARSRAGASPPKRRAKRAEPGATRMKYVWAVCNRRGDAVKQYPYPEKAEAEAELARVNAEEDRWHQHILKKLRVPMDA